jgi:hypothetical protein
MFAQGLRDLRLRAGKPSYRALAARTHFAPSTLSTAASGNRLPSLQVTIAYVRACRGDEVAWHQRWVETSRSIINHDARAHSEVVTKIQDIQIPDTTLKIGRGTLKIAIFAIIFGILSRAWTTSRHASTGTAPTGNLGRELAS